MHNNLNMIITLRSIPIYYKGNLPSHVVINDIKTFMNTDNVVTEMLI
jgi:hypothetical protein